ncbi:hypothetical protein G6M89_18920 [Natronolimnobius sp. AArcel1]|uniref:hypothetical protein n=1 Tax=Natronolimnobius sp. AArcel1 TaxID=1679093 RepID=UPI0013E9FE2B|nr:hypothetical protein [Natronolimnobius sp. AArcel1]NGM71051.1 hypothetical protein [Natronolimnobius sp. AArcel1]
MSQHSRSDGRNTGGDEMDRHRWLATGYSPLLRRPDAEAAHESGWISLTYEDEAGDDSDDTPLSELSEAAVKERLEALE